MENKKYQSPMIIAGEQTNLSPDDVRAIAQGAEHIVANVAGMINNLSTNSIQIMKLRSEIEKDYAKLDHELDVLMVKCKTDERIYEMSLPVLDKQFTACQNRLDKLTDKVMELITEDVSEENRARQEAFMSLIEVTNNSMNSLIAKLIPTGK